eukprot:Hpha_TRINITY_DN16946_c0_g1::TRINITY_DN16946_c0_g1_i1::g.54458::m.54458
MAEELPPIGRPPLQRGRPQRVAKIASAGKSPTASASSTTTRYGKEREVGPRELWGHCEAVFTSFNANTHTLDSHVAEYLGTRSWMGENERAFIEQVSYGCQRYKPLLTSAVGRYLAVKRRMNDCFVAFVVLTYIAMFRIDELGMPAFRALVTGCASHSKISEYLLFIFAEGSAESYFADEWRRTFDDTYVEETLLGHINRYRGRMLALAAEFDVLASGQEQRLKEQAEGKIKVTAKPSTRPAPFPLSQSRPRVAPEPEPEPPAQRPRRPIDTSTTATKEALTAFRAGKQLTTLDPDVREENRRKEASKSFQPPALHSLNERPSKFSEVVRKVEEEEFAKTRPEFESRPDVETVRRKLAKLPSEAPKVTAAALLREDAVWRKREEEAQAVLRKKETELRDDSEFREWQAKKLAEDDEQARAVVAQRKVEMMLADEEARAARRRQEKKNAKEAHELRVDTEEKLTRMREADAAREAENRQCAAIQKDLLKENVKKANTVLSTAKKETAKNVREEDRMLELKLAENMELELLRKAEIIREIREHVETIKYDVDPETGKKTRRMFRKDFDPESTMGLGTLGEMSLAELYRKLSDTKAEVQKQRMEKNATITAEIDSKKREHSERLETVEKRRQHQRFEKEMQREMRREERRVQEEKKRSREEERLVALQGKLKEKRDERKREEEIRRERERARLLQQQYKAADKGAREAKNWAQKELGQERIAQRDQKSQIAFEKTTASVRDHLARERERNVETKIQRTRKARTEQASRVRSEHQRLVDQQDEDELTLRRAATAERHRKTQSRKVVQSVERTVLEALDSMTLPCTL